MSSADSKLKTWWANCEGWALINGRPEEIEVVDASDARTLERRLTAAEARVRELERALRDVIDPVGKIKREMGPGYVLDGRGAVAYADNVETAREIARAALADPPKGEQSER